MTCSVKTYFSVQKARDYSNGPSCACVLSDTIQAHSQVHLWPSTARQHHVCQVCINKNHQSQEYLSWLLLSYDIVLVQHTQTWNSLMLWRNIRLCWFTSNNWSFRFSMYSAFTHPFRCFLQFLWDNCSMVGRLHLYVIHNVPSLEILLQC